MTLCLAIMSVLQLICNAGFYEYLREINFKASYLRNTANNEFVKYVYFVKIRLSTLCVISTSKRGATISLHASLECVKLIVDPTLPYWLVI